MPPRRFWIRVGSVTVAEGTKWNGAGLSAHIPGRPQPVQWFGSVEELKQNMADWGWGTIGRIHWIDAPEPDSAEWDAAVAGCTGVGE